MSGSDHFDDFTREFERLGLDWRVLGGLAVAGGEDGVAAFLTHLRSLQPGATWHDVLPNLPADWTPGEPDQPEQWIGPYKPLGPYDYQELPTGPAVHVNWPKETDASCLESLIGAGRDAGWSIHGAGFIEIQNPSWPTIDAMIVLDRSADLDVLFGFAQWLEQQPDVKLATVPRTGDERYEE